MELRPLHPTIGVEVAGVDLRAPLRPGQIDALRGALDHHHLLSFRGQHLTGEQQVAFVGRFGPLLAERNLWAYVSNVRPDGIVREGGLLFHSDFAFAAEPTLVISLHALEVPADGAPTLFADATAVARLPAALRAGLAGRHVRNVYDFTWPGDRKITEAQLGPGMPRTDHPVIAPSVRTGEPVVLANEMHSDRIVEVPRERSDQLLAELFAVLYAEDNVYEHRWQVGDLVIWDNVALHHGRRTIPLDEPRTLQRVTLGRYTPVELVPDLDALLARR